MVSKNLVYKMGLGLGATELNASLATPMQIHYIYNLPSPVLLPRTS